MSNNIEELSYVMKKYARNERRKEELQEDLDYGMINPADAAIEVATLKN